MKIIIFAGAIAEKLMKPKLNLISWISVLLTSVMFFSCESPVPDNGDDMGQTRLESYDELLKAYDEGLLFKSVTPLASANLVLFEDGTEITVPLTSFPIYNHQISSVPTVSVTAGTSFWSIGGKQSDIPVLSSDIPDKDALPVYVYYDTKTLYMLLSNCQVLKFNSKALILQEENKLTDAEIARRQNIPVIYIDTRGVEIKDKENYVDGTITIEDPEKLYSDVVEFSAPMGIRGRGNSTWGFPKKPWKVKLKEKASLLGMPADKEWALLANYADRTLLRNLTAMHLSEICDFPWTPRMRSVEVYLNNKYQGVYTLCEHKKVSEDRVDIDVDAGDVYLEIEQQQDETTCWWTGMGVPMMFSDPEIPSEEQLAQVKKMFDDFEKALRAKDFSSETGYPKYIDVDSFIDYYIVQELTKNIDGDLRKSSFITIEVGGKMVMYHLWDFDLTLGNAGYFDAAVGNSYDNFWVKRSRWYPYLFNDPAFVDRLQERWAELYPQLVEVPDFIAEQALYISKAKDRNFQKWSIYQSIDWVNFPSLGSYEKELAYLTEFYRRRLGWLNVELNKL